MADDSDWRRQLLVGMAVLLAVGALIGGIVGFVSIKAADLAGINGSTPTTSGQQTDQPANTATSRSQPSTTPRPAPSTGAPATHKPSRTFALAASPTSVSTYERINLTGTCRAASGTTLQVQRRETGSWIDFPTTVSISDGAFATYVETGRVGLNAFRVTNPVTGASSNPVVVSVS